MSQPPQPPQPPRWESPVEKQIREAMERGEFDNLPGAGKPLRNLDGNDDGMWWVRQLAEREQLDFSGALPPALQLRKEAAAFPGSLAGLAREESVREVLEDYNRRVRRDRLRPPDPGLPQLLAPTVDVDDLVEQWRVLRAEQAAQRQAQREAQRQAQREADRAATGPGGGEPTAPAGSRGRFGSLRGLWKRPKSTPR